MLYGPAISQSNCRKASSYQLPSNKIHDQHHNQRYTLKKLSETKTPPQALMLTKNRRNVLARVAEDNAGP